MLNYSHEEIKKILEEILKESNFTIKPVGNHSIKRHLVYEIALESGKKYIFKLYYIDKRRAREIATLKLLEGSSVRCPSVYAYGNLDTGEQWLITEWIEGEVLDCVMDKLSYENKINIFNTMGEELGKLHSFKIFEFIGEWDEGGIPINPVKDYREYFMRCSERNIEDIYNQKLPDEEIISKAIDEIRSNYELINSDVEPRLVHGDFDGRNILVRRNNDTYEVSGVIDFETAYPRNVEQDFSSLYYRYFLDDKELEASFLRGYNKYLNIDRGFKERIYVYLLTFGVGNCSWAYVQATDYYYGNVEFLKRLIKDS
ncbi:MAG: aminoglycoside phosphotransferase family protein [Clostridium sp.]|uniref:phosphotransferase family protein n=1 Tax=Clostridium sp. TaxID=1506 RepID=UPI0030691F40